MVCEECLKEPQSMDELIVLTFHRLMRHSDKEINGYETKNEYGEDFREYD